ncbi:toll/interleukin-1 receptor domain-containing protein [Streptomyces microflavus]|uniref:toll/interleukin-1 receptor domain-containing protein n=1 Tax=Streptomyces microflavus TaxID=1919 RepID=UPI0033BF22CF
MREVFISHSARGDTFAEDVLEAVTEGLKAKGHEPCVDSGIQPGVPWRDALAHWLYRCGAAVVLLNESALESDWVRREVTILMWRRQLGADLFVLPVLLGEVCPAKVKEAGLGELNLIQLARNPGGGELHADDLARQVVDQFADMSAVAAAEASGDPMKKWLERIETYMPRGPQSHKPIDEAMRKLAGAAYPYSSGESQRSFGDRREDHLLLAHQFLTADPDRLYEAVCALSPALSIDMLGRLCTELRAMWVAIEAARGLLPQPGTTPQEMTILLNASKENTVREYIRRATCGDFNVNSVFYDGVLPTGEGAGVEIKADLEASMWRDVFGDEPPEGPTEIAPLRGPNYLVINKRCPPSREIAEAVKLLHRDHSWLILVLTTGSAPVQETVTRAFNNAFMLNPLLTVEGEKEAHRRNFQLSRIRHKLVENY